MPTFFSNIEDLVALKAGWMNGEGDPLDPVGCRDLSNQFDRFFDADLPLPSFYPTVDGGVRVEWTIGAWSVSLEVDLESLHACYLGLNMTSDEWEMYEFELMKNDAGDWDLLNKSIRKLVV